MRVIYKFRESMAYRMTSSVCFIAANIGGSTFLLIRILPGSFKCGRVTFASDFLTASWIRVLLLGRYTEWNLCIRTRALDLNDQDIKSQHPHPRRLPR